MKVTDMNGVEIKIGDKVKRHPIINKRCDNPRIVTIEHIGHMHSNREVLVWFLEGGGPIIQKLSR